MKLDRDFFARPATRLAPALLGLELVHETDDGVCAGLIVETEAYAGPDDAAAHSYGGRRTARTEAMFGEPGRAYIYLIYGMYFCFNIVAAREGKPEAVLVRALEPTDGVEHMARRRGSMLSDKDWEWLRYRRGRPSARLRNLTNGPGKLCMAMGINARHYGQQLSGNTPLYLRAGIKVEPRRIATGPRINIDYSGAWARKPWRYWLPDNPFVSR